MRINNTLTPANLEALRKAIINEVDLINNVFGGFSFSCTAKNLKAGNINYLIKFTPKEDPDQHLVISSGEPLPYVITMLVAHGGGYANWASLRNRFPFDSDYIDRAFMDYQTHKSLIKLEAAVEEKLPTMGSDISQTLYLDSILTRVNFILIVGMIWKLFLN